VSEARIGNSIDLPPMPLPPELPPDEHPATLDDVVPLLTRIAEALEAQGRPTACAEQHDTGSKCVLDDRHIGHHTSGDGRLHWLDDD
jgi:hypothetical protein